MKDVILVANSGSSSIKMAIFDVKNKKINNLLHRVSLEKKGDEIIIHVDATEISEKFPSYPFTGDLINLMIDTFESWWSNQEGMNLVATGHRVVHGGSIFKKPTIVTDAVEQQLSELIHLAPLHQPYNLKALEASRQQYPDKLHVACFDTAFHSSQDRVAQSFGLPKKFYDQGIYKYGFHGLSYEWVTRNVKNLYNQEVPGKMIIAHLGNGSSMCAVKNGVSIASSMSFTAVDGLMMGTRCGSIDPGVILYFLTHGKMTIDEVTKLLYKESGLLGVSTESYDVRVLLDSTSNDAKFALELFVYRAQLEIGRLVAALGGLDALVFTAGIGENSAVMRDKITQNLSWLGVELNHDRNKNHKREDSSCISSDDSLVKVWAMPTNEERVIAESVANLL
jgi:acetate kinase